jgi:hypothetical protein
LIVWAKPPRSNLPPLLIVVVLDGLNAPRGRKRTYSMNPERSFAEKPEKKSEW